LLRSHLTKNLFLIGTSRFSIGTRSPEFIIEKYLH
jgi:hypothetical protein